MLDRNALFLMILGVCVVNGIFSPYLNVAVPITVALMPELFPKTHDWVLFFSSVFVSSCTLFFSGVPAALYERLIERNPEGTAAMWIWLAGAAFLSIPAIRIVMAIA
ncbi:MAG: hypothetical protein L6R19_14475 [Alphaproteobacteria bacterium]|nr:hypothetical protein [Alphaproteobacteria bacterium]